MCERVKIVIHERKTVDCCPQGRDQWRRGREVWCFKLFGRETTKIKFEAYPYLTSSMVASIKHKHHLASESLIVKDDKLYTAFIGARYKAWPSC